MLNSNTIAPREAKALIELRDFLEERQGMRVTFNAAARGSLSMGAYSLVQGSCEGFILHWMANPPLASPAAIDAAKTMVEQHNSNAIELPFETRTRLAAEFDAASKSAVAGCGASDVLYCNRYSEAVDAIIEKLPEDQRSSAYALAHQHGDYATEDERQAGYERDIADGRCGLTGIEPDYCPCGRHE